MDQEKRLVEELSDAKVAAISTWGDLEAERDRHGLPAVNIYDDGSLAEPLAAAEAMLERPDG